MGAKVAVVGSINVDLVTKAARFPRPGETILGGDLKIIAGGKGANQAVAAARLGADVVMIGRLGNDVFASRLRQNLVDDGVDVSHIYTSEDSASGVALIVVDDEGQNSIVVSPGANAKLTTGDVEQAADAIASSDVLLLQLEVPLDTVQRAAEIAKENGVTVILNPAPAQPLPGTTLSLVDILIPNESELSILSSLQALSLREMKEAASSLRDFGVETVIVTAGAKGSLLVGTDVERHFPAYPTNVVVDTTAAGDAFVGGVATAIGEGKTLTEAVPWGNAAGALAITREGAQPSLPSRAEVEAFLRGASRELLIGIAIK